MSKVETLATAATWLAMNLIAIFVAVTPLPSGDDPASAASAGASTIGHRA